MNSLARCCSSRMYATRPQPNLLHSANVNKTFETPYTNWRGVTEKSRQMIPERIFFGSTDWHATPQWLLHAKDPQKDEMRDFALKDMFALPSERRTQTITPHSNHASDNVVEINYTNWRKETGSRLIIPESISFGSTEWHPEPQWLLRALDVEKKQPRDFALNDIHSWTPVR